MAPFDGKYVTYSLMTIVRFALSLTIYEIFARQNTEFHLEHEGQALGKLDLRRSIRNVRSDISDFFFRILAARQHTFTQKDTHTARDRSDDYRLNMQSRVA